MFSKKYEYTKTINVETIEDNDANLKRKAKANQQIPKIKKNLYDRANITPRYVATPFPPLNFSQIGKTCPNKQVKAEYIAKSLK